MREIRLGDERLPKRFWDKINVNSEWAFLSILLVLAGSSTWYLANRSKL